MDKITKCIWLTTVISKAGSQGITLSEINEKWQNVYDADAIPRKTFDNYKHYIEDMFDINIDCIKSRNAYVIKDADAMYGNKLKMWLLNSFAMSSMLAGNLQLRKRIQFEEIPTGIEFLEFLIHAMKENFVINLSYQAFYWEEAYLLVVQPYALKLFKQRWYLIARTNFDLIRLFSLDRIKELSLTDQTFKIPSDFNLEDYYANHFGIVHDDGSVEILQLKVESEQAKYLKCLPWHASQRVVTEGDGFVVFEWELHLTFDLRQQIFSLGSKAEVLAPIWYRDEVNNELQKTLKNYAKE